MSLYVFKKEEKGQREMAQSVKCPSRRHKDLALIPSSHVLKTDRAACTRTLELRRLTQEYPGGLLDNQPSLPIWQTSGPSKRFCLIKQGVKFLGETPETDLWPPQAH